MVYLAWPRLFFYQHLTAPQTRIPTYTDSGAALTLPPGVPLVGPDGKKLSKKMLKRLMRKAEKGGWVVFFLYILKKKKHAGVLLGGGI